jgi:hypothetical protein
MGYGGRYGHGINQIGGQHQPAPDRHNVRVPQHSVLCQTSLPYRDPGDEVRLWKRANGRVKLELQAGRLLDPTIDDFVDVGLPFGPKPRLVLCHLNAEALRTQSPFIFTFQVRYHRL